MKIPFHRFLLVSALFLFTLSLSAQSGIEFFEGTLAEAQTLAKEEGKLIFLDAYTVWCGPCRWMSSKIFTDEEVGEFFNTHFVNFKMDMERGEGPGFARKYGVRAYPTLFFLTEEGETFSKVLGAKQKDQLISLAKQTVTQAKVRKGLYVEDRSE